MLTVATDSPAYDPWFENNTPSNGKGYESAVAYAVAKQLGFPKSQVKWTVEPFDASFAPGPKSFDFDINEISYTPERATVVSFSVSYYAVQQALVALKKSPIVKHHTPGRAAHLRLRRPDRLDEPGLHQQRAAPDAPAVGLQHAERRQVGPPGRPHPGPRGRHADGAVHQLLGDPELGPRRPVPEHGGALRAAVRQGRQARRLRGQGASTRSPPNGTLAKLQHEWLGIYTSVPTIKP